MDTIIALVILFLGFLVLGMLFWVIWERILNRLGDKAWWVIGGPLALALGLSLLPIAIKWWVITTVVAIALTVAYYIAKRRSR